MAVTRQQKAEILKGLLDQFARSKSVVFAEYKGIGVHPMSDLRRKLRKASAECKVAKKTLLRLAAKQNNFPEFDAGMMSGQVAAAFAYTEDFGAFKALYLFAKENEKLKILGGVVNGKVMTAAEIIQLAILPGREELLAKMLGSLMSPVSAFVRALNALKEKLESSAATPAPEAPKAEAPATPPATPAV